MAFIFSKNKWQQQPPGFVEWDDNNPLFRGARQLYNFSDPINNGASALSFYRNYANSNGVVASQGGGGPITNGERIGTQAGICFYPNFNGSLGAISEATTSGEVNLANPWTYFAVMSIAAFNQQIIAQISLGGAFDRSLTVSSGITLRTSINDGSTKVATNSISLVANRPYKVVVSASSSLLSIWVDGGGLATTTISRAGYNAYGSNPPLQIGDPTGLAGTQLSLFGRLDNYAWTQAEVNAWLQAPFQCWRKMKRYFVPKFTAAVISGIQNMGASSGGAGWVENKVNAVGAAS
jgi:hypothetical protein